MKRHYYSICIIAILRLPSFAGVTVTSPTNGAVVGSPVHYLATANTTTCSKGVASMGIYVNNQLTYVVNGTSLNTNLNLSPGSYNTVVEEWDYCGGATYTPVPITVTNQTGVWVTAPANNSTDGSPVNFVATASTASCSKGVASMGIYVNNQLLYTTPGKSLNTRLFFSPGTYNSVVEEWDYCGGAAFTPVKFTVPGTILSNLHAKGGWAGYGELPPVYAPCSWPCSGVTWSMTQHVQSPAITGDATKFDLGGTTPYADILWTNPVIGQNSSQGLPDSNHTLLPTLHNFTYDAYFYGTNLALSQVLEFDVNQYMNGQSFIWGNQCRIAGGHEWDIWDNVNAHWIPTGVPCYPVSNGWNHVTIEVARTWDNWLLFQSITLNGVTYTLGQYYKPGSVPSGWWGITLNFQTDGNYQEAAYSVFLDKVNFIYW